MKTGTSEIMRAGELVDILRCVPPKTPIKGLAGLEIDDDGITLSHAQPATPKARTRRKTAKVEGA